MSEMTNEEKKEVVASAPVAVAASPAKAALKDVEAVRDLFARAHDYIAQAQHPGHMGGKIAEVLNFLAFQYNDFKLRGERLAKQIASEVDVEAAKKAVDTTLAPVSEAPKA